MTPNYGLCVHEVRRAFTPTMFALVAKENLELIQMDVKIAFLHGDLDEEIYMEQFEGYET